MDLHLVQISVLGPILGKLKAAGIRLDPLLRESGLDRFTLDDPEGYVPREAVYDLFEAVCLKIGTDNLAGEFADQIKMYNLGKWGQAVTASPDLLTICRKGDRFGSHSMSFQRTSFEVDGSVSAFRNMTIDEPSIGKARMEQISLLFMLDSYRQAAGPNAMPTEIHFTSSTAQDLEHLPQLHNTKIRFGQDKFGLFFPTSELALPVQKPADTPSGELAHPGTTMAENIERILETIRLSLPINIEMIAGILDTSPRTLQRYLAEQGTNFREIVDQWRFKTAIIMLGSSGVLIREIGERLHYANTPNFERAFQRWTGTTPQRYREGLA